MDILGYTPEHPTNAIKYDDVRDGPISLSSEEQAVFLKKAEELRKLLTDKTPRAKYKLEIIFGKARSSWMPTPGAITWWENGSKFHGGGDVKLYLCPGRSLEVNDCEKPIPELANSAGTLVCPSCGSTWKGEQVIGELLFNLPMSKWAQVLYRYYRVFEYNADVYLKYAPKDIRSLALSQVSEPTWRGSEKMDHARSRRVSARQVYPLRNIIKDTSAGADLLTQLHKFLLS